MFKNYGDITKISGKTVEKVDCVIGGSPCQNLSISGNREGLQGSESRLFLEQMRVIEEMLQSSYGVYPRYMVWENVVGSLSCNRGKDFQSVLNKCVHVACSIKQYGDNNYVRQQIPDVPMPKDGKWPKSGILYDDMGRWSIAWRVHDAQYWGVAQRRRRIALVVDFGGLTAPEVLFESKSVSGDFNTCHSQREGSAERAIGSITESSKQSYIYDARGNGSGKLEATLTGDHDNRVTDYTNVVLQKEPYLLESNQNHATINNDSICTTLAGKTNPCICIGNGQAHVTSHYTEEVCQTLNCMHDPMAILEPRNDCTYLVRRLTPLECTRLQGFPDGWVDIGDWLDSKGKKHKDSDTPKYKALGNSIALPFWGLLCKRIVTKIKEQNKDLNYTPTMASLFAGIGGFDLCWTEVTENKDSVLWVSEIEEFPIAVLKYHFS